MTRTFKTGWFDLYVRLRYEKKVDNLLAENQYESYLPTVKTIPQWSDRKKIILKLMFPTYVFV